jgi:glutamyl-tRNA synthetase
MNGEYFKKMDTDAFYKMAEATLKESVKKEGVCHKMLAGIVQSRITFLKDIPELLDFIDKLPNYSPELYVHKKMKTDEALSIESLKKVIAFAESHNGSWDNETLSAQLTALAEKEGLKNGQILWPIRTALSGKPTSPCGASELMVLLGKDESITRMKKGIEVLSK